MTAKRDSKRVSPITLGVTWPTNGVKDRRPISRPLKSVLQSMLNREPFAAVNVAELLNPSPIANTSSPSGSPSRPRQETSASAVPPTKFLTVTVIATVSVGLLHVAKPIRIGVHVSPLAQLAVQQSRPSVLSKHSSTRQLFVEQSTSASHTPPSGNRHRLSSQTNDDGVQSARSSQAPFCPDWFAHWPSMQTRAHWLFPAQDAPLESKQNPPVHSRLPPQSAGVSH